MLIPIKQIILEFTATGQLKDISNGIRNAVGNKPNFGNNQNGEQMKSSAEKSILNTSLNNRKTSARLNNSNANLMNAQRLAQSAQETNNQ